MGSIGLDLRHARRWLWRNPTFTVGVVAVLALGIGLNAAVFSIVNAVLLRPPPVAEPDRLLTVYSQGPDDPNDQQPLSGPEADALEAQGQSLEAVVVYAYTPLAIEQDDGARLVLGTRVSHDFFQVLGVGIAQGRGFSPPAGEVGSTVTAPDEVLLGDRAWRRRFGADPSVIGQTLRVNGRPVSVVGVLERRFTGLTRGVAPEVWLPLDEQAWREPSEGPAPRGLWTVARLRQGVGPGEAQAEIRALGERWLADPASVGVEVAGSQRGLTALPLRSVRILPGVDAQLGTASWIVLITVALVMLVAGFNVANLLLARGLARRRELATRRALGAPSWVLARQLLLENSLLAGTAAAVGLALAWLSNTLVTHVALPLPVDLALGLTLDGRVVLFTVAMGFTVALLVGLVPMGELLRPPGGQLGARGVGLGRRQRWQSALVVGQVALSALLLVAAGLMVRSVAAAHRVDPGFEPAGVGVATFAPGLQGAAPDQVEAFFDRLRERVAVLPGVQSVGLASHLPLTIELELQRFSPAAAETSPVEAWPLVDSARVDPGYFATLNIPVLRGRSFHADDRPDSPSVVVVNRALAERFWPGENVLGQRLSLAGSPGWSEVVGVVADGRYRTLGESPRPFLYRPLDQVRWNPGGAGDLDIDSGSETLLVRTDGDPQPILAEIRQVAQTLDPGVAMARLEPLEETLGLVLFLPRASAGLFGLLGAVALVLSMAGLYGMMAFTVAGRAREIGLRRALGATRRQVARHFARRGFALTAGGLAIGTLGAVVLGPGLSGLLYGVGAHDPLTLGVVGALLLAIGVVASWLPARAAADSDPWHTLHSE